MLKKQNFLISYKLFFSLLGFSAIITEIATITERGNFNPVNFFSYFTIQNNILASIVLLLSALALAAGRKSRILDVLRGLSTVYILVVGIGFAILLSGLENSILTAVPWDNLVLHYIMPVAVLTDHIIDRPKTKLRFKNSLIWLLFPVSYLIYSLIRGAITDWYPYPFLNPAKEGYEGVALVSLGLLALSVALIWLSTDLLLSSAKRK